MEEVVGSNPTGTTNIKLCKMRDWMIKNWYFNWDSKIFGEKFGGVHLRVVNTLIVLICVAGLANLLIDGFGIGQALLFAPFFLVFFPTTRKWISGDYTYEDLDWEQKLQYLKFMEKRGEAIDQAEYKRLDAQFINKYRGNEKFVESWRIIFPFLVILITLVIYWFTGEVDSDYDRYSRFF